MLHTADRILAIVQPKTGIRKRNPENLAEAFARQFHSLERVELVKAQPCQACGRLWASENAHVLGNDGGRRRGRYTTIAALCGVDFHRDYVGCHTLYDEHFDDFCQMYPTFDPVAAAAEIEARWQRHLGRIAS